MSLKQQRRDNIHIQNNMYESKSSKSVYKGLKACLFILLCLLFIGYMNYQKLMLYDTGYKSNTSMYWLYSHIGIQTLVIAFSVLCVLIICIGIWDVKRLKAMKNKI